MRVAEIIKTAREGLGLTQEDLAEKMDVSRQAVSKWELGASVPTAENLDRLAEILNVEFPPEETAPAEPEKPTSAVPWKGIAITLGSLLVLAVILLGLLLAMPSGGGGPAGDLGAGHEPLDTPLTPSDSAPPQPASDPEDRRETAENLLPQNVLRHPSAGYLPLEEPAVTGVYFLREDGTPMDPDLGDGWCSLTVGQRVLLLVTFRQGVDTGVHGAALFATPTGTETYDEREQLVVQSVYDRTFALFSLEFSEPTTLHMDITLECDGGSNVVETLNVAALSLEDSILLGVVNPE